MKLTSAEKREVDRIARKIHRCPERYVGPCWGPIPEDIEEATRQVIEGRPARYDRPPAPSPDTAPEGASKPASDLARGSDAPSEVGGSNTGM